MVLDHAIANVMRELALTRWDEYARRASTRA